MKTLIKPNAKHSGEKQAVAAVTQTAMRCLCIRTAMCGGGLSYDCYVPMADVPAHVRDCVVGGSYFTRIIRDSREYMDYPIATHSKAHDKQARREMLDLCESVFPELSQVRTNTDSLPELWINHLLPAGIKETSKEIEVIKEITT